MPGVELRRSHAAQLGKGALFIESVGYGVASVDVTEQSLELFDLLAADVVVDFEYGEVRPQVLLRLAPGVAVEPAATPRRAMPT